MKSPIRALSKLKVAYPRSHSKAKPSNAVKADHLEAKSSDYIAKRAKTPDRSNFSTIQGKLLDIKQFVGK